MNLLGQLFGAFNGMGSLFGENQRTPKSYSDAQFVNMGRLDVLRTKIKNWNTGMVPMMKTEYFTKDELDYMHRHGL